LRVERRNFTVEAATQKSPEKHEFQAETRMLLDIVAKSLYSEKEVRLKFHPGGFSQICVWFIFRQSLVARQHRSGQLKNEFNTITRIYTALPCN
jgi:hypothetical protein